MSKSSSITVLVADDFSSVRKIIRSFLVRSGIGPVFEAEDGQMAWEILHKEKIDLILCDWNMPVLSGIDLLHCIRKSEDFASLPFIMVTSEAHERNIIETIQARMTDYIVKPFTGEMLLKKIKAIYPE